jgi:hypothetical protein
MDEGTQQLILTVSQAVQRLPPGLRDKLNRDGGMVFVAAIGMGEDMQNALASHTFFAVAGERSSPARFSGEPGIIELQVARSLVIEEMVGMTAEVSDIPYAEVLDKIRQQMDERT